MYIYIGLTVYFTASFARIETRVKKGAKVAILVTGGSGYIGSVTVEMLRAQGEQVVILDDLFRGHAATIPDDVPFYTRARSATARWSATYSQRTISTLVSTLPP